VRYGPGATGAGAGDVSLTLGLQHAGAGNAGPDGTGRFSLRDYSGCWCLHIATSPFMAHACAHLSCIWNSTEERSGERVNSNQERERGRGGRRAEGARQRERWASRKRKFARCLEGDAWDGIYEYEIIHKPPPPILLCLLPRWFLIYLASRLIPFVRHYCWGVKDN